MAAAASGWSAGDERELMSSIMAIMGNKDEKSKKKVSSMDGPSLWQAPTKGRKRKTDSLCSSPLELVESGNVHCDWPDDASGFASMLKEDLAREAARKKRAFKKRFDNQQTKIEDLVNKERSSFQENFCTLKKTCLEEVEEMKHKQAISLQESDKSFKSFNKRKSEIKRQLSNLKEEEEKLINSSKSEIESIKKEIQDQVVVYRQRWLQMEEEHKRLEADLEKTLAEKQKLVHLITTKMQQIRA
eukprot:768182-Hanusia_phi.AAC.2